MASVGTSWGRFPRVTSRVVTLVDRHADLPRSQAPMLVHGNGRSYGDSCLNPDGVLLHARGLDRFIAFDAATGILECEAGVTLAEILALVVGRGWFLPVTPGTKFVTVGGAIANDVHGKNHHVVGSFGDHVLGLELLRSDGSRRDCVPGDAWFAATIGGLGLTGLITTARLQLRRIQGPWLAIETRRFARLAGFFELSDTAAASEYNVAWVDCLADGNALGRGIFFRGDHAPATPPIQPQPATRRLAIPVTPPLSLVNPLSLRVFNASYFHRAPRRARLGIGHYDPFFYPLDRIENWNKLYGPRGFLQYQCVVPPEQAEAAIAELLQRISRSKEGSFLAVLKQFGCRTAPGMMSFPRPGTTLALDFRHRGERTLRLLSSLDEVVMAAGGALYPAKDARMSPAMFHASFPNLAKFHEFVDPCFSSGLWRRVQGGK
jgi:FAD/FMN-containing dehydrogenase